MKGKEYADCIYCPGVAKLTGGLFICLDCNKEFTEDDIILKTYEKVNDLSTDTGGVQPGEIPGETS